MENGAKENTNSQSSKQRTVEKEEAAPVAGPSSIPSNDKENREWMDKTSSQSMGEQKKAAPSPMSGNLMENRQRSEKASSQGTGENRGWTEKASSQGTGGNMERSEKASSRGAGEKEWPEKASSRGAGEKGEAAPTSIPDTEKQSRDLMDKSSSRGAGEQEESAPTSIIDNEQKNREWMDKPSSQEIGEKEEVEPTCEDPGRTRDEDKESRVWMAKLEMFAVKFLNRIFRRSYHDKKLREAVKPPPTCKTKNWSPFFPYPTDEPKKTEEEEAEKRQQDQEAEEAEEHAIMDELNTMLDEINNEVQNIPEQYLSKVTPLFESLVELKERDFRKTDNREIFNKVDDYLALIKCDIHICLASPMARLESLIEFINVIKNDAESLRKFPRIVTRCYSTESRICQEICEVYSDDDFQTVNIKKMSKMKPKAVERPPWRLSYKIGGECFKYPGTTGSNVACKDAAPTCCDGGGVGGQQRTCAGSISDSMTNKKSCFSGSTSIKPCCFRRKRLRFSLNRGPNGCDFCESTERIPPIPGILFTRFREPDPEVCPLIMEGHATNDMFPSITNFENIRPLNIPQQNLFNVKPKCYNPPPHEARCFGGGLKISCQQPRGGKNPCGHPQPLLHRDRRNHVCPANRPKSNKHKRKKSAILDTTDTTTAYIVNCAAQGTSTTGLLLSSLDKSSAANYLDGMYSKRFRDGVETSLSKGGPISENFIASILSAIQKPRGTFENGSDSKRVQEGIDYLKRNPGEPGHVTYMAMLGASLDGKHEDKDLLDLLALITSKPSRQAMLLWKFLEEHAEGDEPLLKSILRGDLKHGSSKPLCVTASKPSVPGISRCPQSKTRVHLNQSGVILNKSGVRLTKSLDLRNVGSCPSSPSQRRLKPACVSRSAPSVPCVRSCYLVKVESHPTKPQKEDDPSIKGDVSPNKTPSFVTFKEESIPPPDDDGRTSVISGKTSSKPASDKATSISPGSSKPPSDKATSVSPESVKTPSKPGSDKASSTAPESVKTKGSSKPVSDKGSSVSPESVKTKGSSKPVSDKGSSVSPESVKTKASSKPVSDKGSSVSPGTGRSLSLHSKGTTADPATTEEELEKSPIGSFAKPETVQTRSPKLSKPTRKRPPKPKEPDCSAIIPSLPECDPLRTPYPPQYRFDEVRLQRYLKQCQLLKEICNMPEGEQCWKGPPSPPPPNPRDKLPPFPPDPCSEPPLFPGMPLGLGCSVGLPSGNCYGYHSWKGKNLGVDLSKPEECTFDCGGVCPMGLLGEPCSRPPTPPYVHLKKKKKQDEVFVFDYITVKRDKKAAEPEPEQDYCDRFKAERQCEEDEEEDYEQQCEDRKAARKARKSHKKKRTKKEAEFAQLPPSDEISRFLQRRDVQLVKEQKAQLVKKYHGNEDPEKMLTEMETFYRKAPDGRITTEYKNQPGPTLAPLLQGHLKSQHFMNECVQETQWEREFKMFEKSCQKPKTKPPTLGATKPPLPGFVGCPLPQTAPIMCHVPDPNNPGLFQCQAIPMPMSGLNNNIQYAPDGTCVIGAGAGTGITAPIPWNLVSPAPPNYDGYVLQQGHDMLGQMAIMQPTTMPGGSEVVYGGVPIDDAVLMSGGTPPVDSQESPGLPNQSAASNNYPYMCEIRYNEPIHGSIYGRTVTRRQPCRLLDPNNPIPPDHPALCPVIMETPFYNPSCRQPEAKQSSSKPTESKT